MNLVGLVCKKASTLLKLGVMATLSAASSTHASDYFWSGNIDSSFATEGNWWEDIDATIAGAVPGAADRAIFNANNFSTAPLGFGSSRSLGGMVFNANASSPMILGATVNDFILSLGAFGIDVQSGSAAHLINSGVTLTATQTWNNSSLNPFTIAGNFTTGAHTLNITGSQDFIISGASAINGAAVFNHTGTGELLLSGAVNLTNNLTLRGTGDTTLQGGTIQLTGGSRTFFVENTGNVIFGNIDTSDGTARAITFDVAAGANPIVNGIISDSGAVIKSGKGTLTLNGANSFSSVGSGLRVNDGKVIVNTANSNNPRINMGGVAGGSPILELNAVYRTESIVYDATNNSNGAIINGTGVISLNGNRTLSVGNSTNADTDLSIMVPITNGDSTGRALIKSGAGTVYMGGVNTFTGTFTIQNGTVIQGASQTAAGGLTLGGAATGTPILSIENGVVFRLGGTLSYSATNNPNEALINGEGTLGLFGNRSFSIGDSSNAVNELTILTAITDGDATARNVAKTGAGNLVMRGANTYGGSTSIFNGSLILDYSLNNGDNKLSNSADVAMQGGRLELQGNDSDDTTETAGTMTVSSGSNTVALFSNGGEQMNFSLASLTRATGAGLINFQVNDPGLVTVTAAAGAANNANGFLGGWAAYNGTRWAARNVSNEIVAYTGAVKNNLDQWMANDDIIIDGATTGTLKAPVISSLILDTSGPTTLNIDNHAKTLGLSSNALMASASAGSSDVTLQASQLVGYFTGTGGAVEMFVRNEGMGTFTVDANIGATNAPITSALSVMYGGEGVIKLTGVNANLGSTTINGDVEVSGGSALADYSSLILGSSSSSLNLNGSTETIGSLSSPSSQTAQINLGTNGALTINQRSSVTYNGSFTGSGTITKEGNATLSLATSSHAGFTGSVEVLGGALDLSMDTNGFSAISSLLLRGGSFLSQQNNGSSRDRIGNNATVILEGTSANGLRVTSNQNSTRTESVNKLVLGSGANVITLSNTATSPTGAITTLAFTNASDAFDRLNNATLLVRSGLADFGGSSTSQTTRVTFASGIGSMLVGDGAGSTATNVAILPFMVGGLSDTNHVGNTFVTVGAQGLRPLLDAEYATTYGGAATTDNVSLGASGSSLSSATFNSLRINAATANVDLTGDTGTTLTLTSGALLMSAAGTVNDATLAGYDTILAGKADAIDDELVIFTTSSNASPAGATLTIGSSIADNGGAATSLTKAGDGTLILTGNNSYSGTTTINQGRVEFSTDGNLGDGGAIRMAGGTLAWAGVNTTDISTRGVELLSASSYVIPASGSVSGIAVITGNTFDTGSNNVSFSQAIGAGGVGGLVKTGAGTLTLQAAATYKGATVIQQGSMNFASIAADTTSALYQVATAGTTSSTIANGLNTGSVITGGAFSTQTGNLVSSLTVNAGDVVIGTGQADLFLIGYRDTATGGNFSSKATVDFTAATSVTVNVDRILLGNDLAGAGSGGTDGDLILSTNGVNQLTASRIVIADTASPGNTGVTSTLTLGENSNAMHTDVLLVGGRKSKGEIIGTDGTFELRSQDGEGGANVFIGDNDASTTGTVSTGVINLNGMTVDARINMLTMGRIATGGASGGAQSTLSYDGGLIEATLIRLADPDHKGNSANDANVRATINQGGTAIMRFLNMSKGNGVATYNWQGGTIQNLANADLTNENVEISLNGSAQTTSVDQRQFTVDVGRKATFQSDAKVSGTGSFTKDGEGELILQGANTNTGNVYVAAGSLSLDGTGSMNDAAWFNIANNAALKLSTLTGGTYSTDAVFSGSGVIDGTGKTLSFTSNIGAANSQSVIRPGASSTNNSLGSASTVGDLTGALTIEGNVILEGHTVRVDRAVLQVGSTNRNAAASFGNYGSLALWVDAIDTDFASFMEGSGTGHDFIDVNGSLTLNESGGITVTTVGGYGGNFGDVFNLLDWNGSLVNNNFTIGSRYRIGTETDLDLILPTLDAAFSWDTSLFAEYGVLVVVPEPQRAMLAMAGLLLMVMRRRRR